MHTNVQPHPEMHRFFHSQPQQLRKIYWGRVPSQSGDAFLLSPLKVSATASSTSPGVGGEGGEVPGASWGGRP